MKTLNFLYTDGRDVVVTDSTLQARGNQYSLKGITDFGLAVIKPRLLPGLLILLLGAFIIADAFKLWIPDTFMVSFYLPIVGEGRIELELITGIVVILVGFGYLLLSGKRYALRIETAEGNKDVVISKRKEYINQVMQALQAAKNSWRNKRTRA